MKTPIALAIGIAVVGLACANGRSVAAYDTCTPGDSCGSGTVCESASSDSSTTGTTSCTHSCTTSSDCPNDEDGVQGVCTRAFDTDSSDLGFCYRSCDRNACAANATCVDAYDMNDAQISACQPNAVDPLGGTTWVSNTIAPIANSDGVTQSTYTIVFGQSMTASSGVVGDFGATFVQVFPEGAIDYPGCTETTTFSGGTFAEIASSSAEGVLQIQDASATTVRTGCTKPSDDVSDEGAYVYDGDVVTPNATPFTIAGGVMTIQGGTGVVPFNDPVPWTFTQQ